MNMLTEPLLSYVCYNGRHYRVRASFDRVLEVQRLYKDKRLADMEKAEQALRMLCHNRMSIWALKPMQKIELLNLIFKEHVELPKRPNVGKQVKTVDFYLDSDYIYASFMQDYGLDLVDCQGKLHWKKFIALFQGLSESTKIKEIMKIRGMEIPAPSKHNQKEIKNLMELKAYYALSYSEDNSTDGLSRLFSALEVMA